MKILLCSYFKFPAGCAGAIRHEKLAQMLLDLGHDVMVVGLGKFNDFKIESYRNIKYISLRYPSSSLLSKVKMRLRYWGELKKIIQHYAPDRIIMDDLGPEVVMKLKRYSYTNRIMLIHDSVEWYSSAQFRMGILSPSYIRKNILNRFLIDKSCRVIAISQYLTKYYRSKDIQCVNIPIVAAEEDFILEKKLEERINFIYAGQAGKKDYLNIMLSAIALLTEEERSRFTFHIFGCTKEQIVSNGTPKEVINLLESTVKIYGRVARETVLEMLKRSDFTLLMRSDKQRYAKAGFPTKLVESLSHATPMIANLTSDLGKYLIDGSNSFIVPQCTAQDLASILRKTLTLSFERRKHMCENAYQTAVDKFHYKYFLSDLENIIK